MKLSRLRKVFCFFAAAVALAQLGGCSVPSNKVPNRPPKIRLKVVNFISPYGTIEPETFSAFFWPTGWSPAETEAYVKTVSDISYESDQKVRERLLIPGKIRDLWLTFKADQCLDKLTDIDKRVPESYKEDDPVEWMAGAETLPEFKKCSLNVETRRKLNADLDRLRGEAVKDVKKADDIIMVNGTQKENQKDIDRSITMIRIESTRKGVVTTVRISGLNPGITQKTEDPSVAGSAADPSRVQIAVYKVESRLLSFDVPELRVNDPENPRKPTGNIFRFALVRVPDLLSSYIDQDTDYDDPSPRLSTMAVFQGDVTLVDSRGKILRKGSSKLIGKFTAQK